MPGAGFPGGSDGKESACNAGDLGSIPVLERSPGGGHGNPLQDSCLENPHGQRSLAGCRPWGRKVSDMTERIEHTSPVLLTLRQMGQNAGHSLRSRYLTTQYAVTEVCAHTWELRCPSHSFCQGVRDDHCERV